MLPVNLEPNPRSKQDTQMNYCVILTAAEEETISLLKTSRNLEAHPGSALPVPCAELIRRKRRECQLES